MARKKGPPKLTISLPNRLPLAGQCSDHEARVRETLIERFHPADPFEEMWIEDIAYCTVAIEHDRAMITAFLHICMNRAYEELTGPNIALGYVDTDPTPLTQSQLSSLEWVNERCFTPRDGQTFLDHQHFAMLLGRLTKREHYQLRQLQLMLHEEMMQRDRIIIQFQRSRRQAMLDAIEFAELASRSADDAPLALLADADATDGPECAALSDHPVAPQGAAPLGESVVDEAELDEPGDTDPDHIP